MVWQGGIPQHQAGCTPKALAILSPRPTASVFPVNVIRMVQGKVFTQPATASTTIVQLILQGQRKGPRAIEGAAASHAGEVLARPAAAAAACGTHPLLTM